jgi:hypothetical protein
VLNRWEKARLQGRILQLFSCLGGHGSSLRL